MRAYQHLCLFMLLTNSVAASILPENDLKLPALSKSQGLTEQEYEQIISKFENVFEPILAKKEKTLIIKRMWKDPTVNAGTYKKGDEIIIKLYGGYARHPMVTVDGYALVICHELGHHLGGKPKKKFETGPGWPSVEGQADFYATTDCLRKLFTEDDNISITESLKIPIYAHEKCSEQFSERHEVAMCKRIVMAGISVGNISADIRRELVPALETADPTVVEVTFEAHPKPQCRLDTYFQGSLQGSRPYCWFRPEEKKGQDFSWPST